MINVNLPEYTTDATHALNLEISRKSKGVCLLMFSGKDSLVAWLNLKKYFKKVIPFHATAFPCSRFSTEYLDYLEDVMGEHILRLVGEEVPMGTARGMYQLPEHLDAIDTMEVSDFSKLDLCEEIRYRFNLPKCWCAVGLNIFDSIDRRIYLNKYKGRNKDNLTFYPCYDWAKPEIINALQQSGVKLPGVYKYVSRTLSGVPSMTCMKVLREHYPEDYDRYLAIWPLAQAKDIRERYLDRKWAERRAAGVVEDEVSAEDGEYESDDGSDVMHEFGIGGKEEE